MKFLSHINPSDYKYLQVINDEWPFQFLSEYSRFYLNFFFEPIYIVYDDKLEAYMPLRFLRMKLFSPAQILFAPFRNGSELGPSEQLLFFERLIEALYYRGNCERLVQPHPFSILAATPPGSRFCEFGTYIVDLENQTTDEILAKFHPKYQKSVIHTARNGAIVKVGLEALHDFYSVYQSTMNRVLMHSDSFEYFQALYSYLGSDNVCCAVVYDQGIPVSGVFLIYTKHSAFLTHAGTHGDSKLYGAAKFLNFEVMKYLKAKGVKRYDFVGVRLNNTNAALEGIFRFKKGFGGDLKQGYLWKLDLLPMKAKMYDVLLKLKSNHHNVKDIIDQVNM